MCVCVWVYGISTSVGYLMPNPLFFTNKQFYFKQFSLDKCTVQLLKTFLFEAIQFSETVIIQTIQFRIIMIFVKTVLFQIIQFNVSTKTFISNSLVKHTKKFHFKQFSLA